MKASIIGQCRLMAIVAMLLVGQAQAQWLDGPKTIYSSITGLYLMPEDVTNERANEVFRVSGKIAAQEGLGILTALGYTTEAKNGRRLRGEVELGYRKFRMDKWTSGTLVLHTVGEGPLNGTKVQGEISTWSLMANAGVVFEAGKLQPYVGGGAGIVMHKGKTPERSFETGGRSYSIEEISDSDLVFAYQARAGVEYQITDLVTVRMGYRYFATGDAKFKDATTSHAVHSVEAGMVLRY